MLIGGQNNQYWNTYSDMNNPPDVPSFLDDTKMPRKKSFAESLTGAAASTEGIKYFSDILNLNF